MATATATQTAQGLITADDLLRLDAEGVRGELIRGALSETMPTGREHGQIAANLTILLGNFVKPRKLGILTASDSGVRLERGPDTVCEPDVAFFSAEKSPPDERVTGYAEVAPDLCRRDRLALRPADRFPGHREGGLGARAIYGFRAREPTGMSSRASL